MAINKYEVCKFNNFKPIKVGLSKLEIQTKTEEITKDATLGATTGATNNLKPTLDAKQEKLVGKGVGQNIKTINGMNIMGQGDLVILPEGSINFEPNVPTTPEDTPLNSVNINNQKYDLKNHYATKKDLNDAISKGIETTTQCKDEVEITGYTGCSQGLAIDLEQGVGDEQFIKIPIIKGQTKRASENYFKLDDKIYVDNGSIKVEAKDNRIVINGTANGIASQIVGNNTKLKFLYYRYKGIVQTGGMSLLICNSSSCYATQTISNKWQEYVFTNEQENHIEVLVANDEFTNCEVEIIYSKEKIANPYYQEYNDHLVNSNNILVSTGIQLWDEQWEVGSIDDNTGENVSYSREIRSKNYIRVEPNKNYCFNIFLIPVYFYDINKKFIKFIYTNNFVVPSDCYYIRFRCTDGYGITYKNDIIFNYGDKPISYEPYKDSKISRCGELSQYDYIDNILNKKHINTTPIINAKTLKFTFGNNLENFKRYFASLPYETKIDKEVPTTNDNIPYLLEFNSNTLHYYIENNILQVFIPINEDINTYFSKNNFEFVYNTKNEIIEDIIPALPDTMAVAIGGMQYQQPLLTNGVPYDIIKIYSSTIQGQINANITTDVEQQKEIDFLTFAIENHSERLDLLEKDIRLPLRYYRHTIKGQDEDNNNYSAVIYSSNGDNWSNKTWYSILMTQSLGKTILNIYWEVDKSVLNAYSGNVLIDNTSECILGVNRFSPEEYSSQYENTTITEDIVE